MANLDAVIKVKIVTDPAQSGQGGQSQMKTASPQGIFGGGSILSQAITAAVVTKALTGMKKVPALDRPDDTMHVSRRLPGPDTITQGKAADAIGTASDTAMLADLPLGDVLLDPAVHGPINRALEEARKRPPTVIEIPDTGWENFSKFAMGGMRRAGRAFTGRPWSKATGTAIQAAGTDITTGEAIAGANWKGAGGPAGGLAAFYAIGKIAEKTFRWGAYIAEATDTQGVANYAAWMAVKYSELMSSPQNAIHAASNDLDISMARTAVGRKSMDDDPAGFKQLWLYEDLQTKIDAQKEIMQRRLYVRNFVWNTKSTNR